MRKQYAHVIVKVNDRDSGIDSEISPPLLFSKLALKTFKATGLGLFAAKSIIKAHNARYGKRMKYTRRKRCQLYFLLFQLSSTIKC